MGGCRGPWDVEKPGRVFGLLAWVLCARVVVARQRHARTPRPDDANGSMKTTPAVGQDPRATKSSQKGVRTIPLTTNKPRETREENVIRVFQTMRAPRT
jgi:hypothetical protein